MEPWILKLGSGFSLAWSAYILDWIWSLRNCQCARSIQLYLLTLIYISFIFYDLSVVTGKNHNFNLFLLGSFILALLSLWFVKKMKDEKCLCTVSSQRTGIYWLSVKQLIAIPIIKLFV